jgi:hypothetical protein
MAQDAAPKRGWRAKWQERRRRKNERLAERINRRPRKLGDEYSADQAEHAIRTIPTSSGGIGGMGC